jgi:hypothetical protein
MGPERESADVRAESTTVIPTAASEAEMDRERRSTTQASIHGIQKTRMTVTVAGRGREKMVATKGEIGE